MSDAHHHSSVDEVVATHTDRTESSATLLSFVAAHEGRHGTAPAASFYLSGADEHDRVELPQELFEILKQAATALEHGQSVNIIARDQEITTQQAAELLGVSRPTVVKLIDSGELRAHVPGAVRRKLRLADVLAYRDELYERRSDFIAKSSETFGVEDGADLADILEQAR